MADATDQPTETLRAALERGRLRKRARQLELAVAALRASIDHVAQHGGPPASLGRALPELRAERRKLATRLRQLGDGPRSPPRSSGAGGRHEPP